MFKTLKIKINEIPGYWQLCGGSIKKKDKKLAFTYF